MPARYQRPQQTNMKYVSNMISSFYQINNSIITDSDDGSEAPLKGHSVVGASGTSSTFGVPDDMLRYGGRIIKIFYSFLRHRNMLNFIRDIYQIPDIEQNGQFLISVLTLAVLGSNINDYIKIFNEKDFFLFTGYVVEMRKRCVGFHNVKYYNKHMKEVKKEVGEIAFNSMMTIF